MIRAVGFTGKTVAVLGLGRTGLATIRALQAGGANVLAWDDNKASRDAAAHEGITCVDIERRDWADIAALVLSPGIAHTYPKAHHVVELARAVGVEIIGDTEVFARALNALPEDERPRVVAVTGTNGKSTTTALITHIFRACGHDAHAGGNIGRACLDLPPPRKGLVYVLELSSYQLELTKTLRANCALWLNLTPDHLDRHNGMKGYIAAKERIFLNQSAEDVAVVCTDDAPSRAIFMRLGALTPAQAVPISAHAVLSHGAYACGQTIYIGRDGHHHKMMTLAQTPSLSGAHNALNTVAALVVGMHEGLGTARMAKACASFTGLAHRMEYLGEVDGVRFVNDSKATNGEAAKQALLAFDTIYWLAGGQAKSGGLDALQGHMQSVKQAYLFGAAKKQFAVALKGKTPAKPYDTLDQALAAAFADARRNRAKKPVVLLSPACASFDQYSSFEERGDAFRAGVEKLRAEQKSEEDV